MAFIKKTWTDRIAEYINRRQIDHEDGTSELVTVSRSEGTISQEGDAFSAENMNDLEDRIESAISELNNGLANIIKAVDLSHDYGTEKVTSNSISAQKLISFAKEDIDGYIPIGVVIAQTPDAPSLIITQIAVYSSTGINFKLKNTTNSAITIGTVNFRILLCKRR